ncbi:ArdC-like ssDNA-binding domain-containing protein [Thermodesulfobacteriota bacterium]
MNTKVKHVLDGILAKFKSGEIPEAVALASYPIPNIPSTKWSFTNRTLMFLSGTGDARGFRQWNKANRWVKKGSRAIYILVPCFKKEINEETGEEKDVIRFFKTSPVFKYEDTKGERLDYECIELPDLPLIQKAKEWGISVKAIPGNYRCHGYYSPSRKEIALATPEEISFFHELSHAAHEKVKGGLKQGQDPLQEIVAELSAQALCRIAGRRSNDTLGNSYKYIEGYAEKVKMTPYSACLKVIAETEKVLNFILRQRGMTIENN